MNRILKLIKLKQHNGDAIWLNIDQVDMITASQVARGGSDISIRGGTLHSIETPEQIVKLIQGIEQDKDIVGPPPPSSLPQVPVQVLETRTLLVASTKHLPESLIARLEGLWNFYPFLADFGPGLLFRADVEDIPEDDDDMMAAGRFLKFAKEKGFHYVLFDPDADTVDGEFFFEHK